MSHPLLDSLNRHARFDGINRKAMAQSSWGGLGAIFGYNPKLAMSVFSVITIIHTVHEHEKGTYEITRFQNTLLNYKLEIRN